MTARAGRTGSMKFILLLFFALSSLAADAQAPSTDPSPTHRPGYLGFDRNEYPGDSKLLALRETFSYAGYWLNNPPGSKTNTWKGKRQVAQAAGFGFLVLFNGRTYAEIKSHGNAAKLGASDAKDAISFAKREGFPSQTVIFLDQEEGGRLLPEQRSYLHAWVDAVSAEGFTPGVYCSGIGAKETSGEAVITARDIRQNASDRAIKYWVVNDACPPSPGCTVRKGNLHPQDSGIDFAEVWQFAQSPKRPDFARGCSNYDKDHNCYAEAGSSASSASRLNLDLNVATSSDPSHGRNPD
jgi:hypothetical protein